MSREKSYLEKQKSHRPMDKKKSVNEGSTDSRMAKISFKNYLRQVEEDLLDEDELFDEDDSSDGDALYEEGKWYGWAIDGAGGGFVSGPYDSYMEAYSDLGDAEWIRKAISSSELEEE